MFTHNTHTQRFMGTLLLPVCGLFPLPGTVLRAMLTSGPPLDLSLLVLTTHHEFRDDFYPHLKDEAQTN